ncbi:MAG: hypothetical protein COA79_06720 [Planctomycetota bacterium]|nr:MAG: hypothetical protein COA79_06720 [Planctomycetota bacterium]
MKLTSLIIFLITVLFTGCSTVKVYNEPYKKMRNKIIYNFSIESKQKRIASEKLKEISLPKNILKATKESIFNLMCYKVFYKKDVLYKKLTFKMKGEFGDDDTKIKRKITVQLKIISKNKTKVKINASYRWLFITSDKNDIENLIHQHIEESLANPRAERLFTNNKNDLYQRLKRSNKYN